MVKATKTSAKLTVAASGKEEEISVEKVLLSVGRSAVTADVGLDKAGVKADERGFRIAHGHAADHTAIWLIFGKGNLNKALTNFTVPDARHPRARSVGWVPNFPRRLYPALVSRKGAPALGPGGRRIAVGRGSEVIISI